MGIEIKADSAGALQESLSQYEHKHYKGLNVKAVGALHYLVSLLCFVTFFFPLHFLRVF